MSQQTKLPTLYKLSNRGKIEEWDVDVIQAADGSPTIRVRWGTQDGKKQTKLTKIKKGKNVGRANETSPQEQAGSEAQSKWNKQLDKGYSQEMPSLEEPKDSQRKLLPMLAKVYGDFKHKLLFPCFIQPKLDGMRCLANSDGLMSRKGKKIVTANHIEQALSNFFAQHPDVVLDGELYVHGASFQHLISAVKRDSANEKSKDIEYHIYDCIDLKNLTASYSQRMSILDEVKKLTTDDKIKFVKTDTCQNEEEIFKSHKTNLGDGYEGSIVRQNSVYEIDKRSSGLLKLKEFQDAEFEIIGFEEDKNGHPVFTCMTDEGAEFRVKPEGDDSYRQELLEDAYDLIGEMATVRFFEWTTSDNPVPRFPICVGIRNYE